jgi:RNA polymerase sigma-70 factor (ECF subfamily)
MPDASDEELMLRYAGGDAAAFEVLYRRYRGPLYRFLLRQAGDAAAEELLQDVWMRVIYSRERYEVRAKFKTWLYTIAHNRLMDLHRSRGQAVVLDGDEGAALLEDAPDGGVAVEVRLDNERAAERLLAALAELPEVQREAFLLQQEGELSLEEIAVATGAGRETVKSRLRYAFAKLRASLEDLR